MEQAKIKKYRKIYTNEELEEFINTSFEQLRSDSDVYQEIQKLGVKTSQVRDYLSLFLDFQEDFNACKHCPGVDKCPKQQKNLKLSLIVNGDIIDRQLSLCEPALKKLEKDKQYLYSDFPDKWQSATVQEIVPLKSRLEIINEMVEILERRSSRWLYVSSKDANGKSYMLVSLLNTLVNVSRGPVACLDCSYRFKELSDYSINEKDRFNEMYNELCKVPVLLLDNFGEGSISEYSLNSILLPLLNERRRRDLLTFFASVYSKDEAAKIYTSKVSSKETASLIKRRLTKLLDEKCGDAIIVNGTPVFKQ